MKTACPNCGAVVSLDSLIANDDAREALAQLMAIGGDLTKLAIRYIGLFRPAKTQLSFARVAKLLGEIAPNIEAQRIERNGQVYDAPIAAWLWAFQTVLAARDSGSLKLPLKSHGYLYEVLTRYQAPNDMARPISAPQSIVKPSATMAALTTLEGLKQ